MTGRFERLQRGLRDRLAHLATYRRDVRRRVTRLATDAAVALVLLCVVGVVVLGAAVAIVFAVSGGGTLAVVVGWVAAFAFAVSLPVVAMRIVRTVYARVGG